MATLRERIRSENPRRRRRTGMLTFEAPGGDRRKKFMPREDENQEMQKVVFSVALSRGEPEN